MEEVRKIGKRGQIVYCVTFDGVEYRRYPAGKHSNYYFHKWKSGGKYYSKLLHHAIWEKEHGTPVPDGYIIHHKDFNPLNNAPDNLQLVTPKEHNEIHGVLPQFNAGHPEHHKQIAYSKDNWNERRALALERLQSSPRICKQCGREFIATNVHQRFCSKSCHHKWQYTSPDMEVDFVCEVCGKTFRGNKYLKPKTCSEQCAHRLSSYKRHYGGLPKENGGF